VKALAWPDVSPSQSQAIRPWLWWVSTGKQSTGKMFIAAGICGLGNCTVGKKTVPMFGCFGKIDLLKNK
jgi:hypothetical protein